MMGVYSPNVYFFDRKKIDVKKTPHHYINMRIYMLRNDPRVRDAIHNSDDVCIIGGAFIYKSIDNGEREGEINYYIIWIATLLLLLLIIPIRSGVRGGWVALI